MKKVLLSLVLAVMSLAAFAQGGISGILMDDTNLPLIGATVTAKDNAGAILGTITDIDGSYSLALKDGDYTVEMTYTGYDPMSKDITVAGSNVDLGETVMSFASIGLDAVNVIASMAVDRKTPVAVTTIKGETIEALVGNQEYPEILRNTPSVYVTKSGGGFGDSRINVRGFNQRNVAVMINGIPVNDMENGWVYWSNWAGLSDVTSSLQIQRGLGSAKTVVPSVGGSINIVTNAADFKQGGKASVSIGNDNYQKYGVMLSSGLKDNGFAATMQLTHTRGDGYVDGTQFRAYSYFLSLSQQLGDNQSLAFTVVGAPQWHHQRDQSRFDNITLDTYVDADGDPTNTSDRGIRFNHRYGMLDGEEFSWRKNFYHKPKAFLNHYWTINEKMDLKTSAYVSFGRGGGTGMRGRVRDGDWGGFDSFDGFGEGSHDENGMVRFDDIVRYNQGQEVAGFGTKGQENGQYLVTSDGRFYFEDGTRNNNGSGFIRRASMNSHNWYGVLSTLTTELTSNIDLIGGIDGRYYKGIHYRRLENLLGAQGYLSRSNENNPTNLITEPSTAEFGNFGDDSYETGNNVLNYWNDGLVSWMGAFLQAEYNTTNLSAFVSVSGSNQGFKRIDYFNYLDSDPAQETDWANHLGGTVKAGLNYNINENHNVFFNAGFLSRQPIFDNVYTNFVNNLNTDAENQQITAFEIGYGFRNRDLRVNVNAYNTIWDNRQFDEGFDAQALTAAGDTIQVDALANYVGVAQRHTGLEIELDYRPIDMLTLTAMASLNNWEYNENFTANLVNTDTEDPLIGSNSVTVFADGIKVGDAAQTTFALGAKFRPVYGLNIYADWYMADNLYADFDILDDQFKSEGGQVVQLPSYSLVNAGVSYRFDWDKVDATFRININNVFDEIYVAELDTNIHEEGRFHENRGFYGFGRTWNAGVKIAF